MSGPLPGIEHYKSLTIVLELAAHRGDEAAWAAALNARNALDIDPAREPELIDWQSPVRCGCCGRIAPSGACGEGAA